MKSLDLNQQGQIIEGELDLKQELISQWKSQKIKLDVDTKHLTIFKSN